MRPTSSPAAAIGSVGETAAHVTGRRCVACADSPVRESWTRRAGPRDASTTGASHPQSPTARLVSSFFLPPPLLPPPPPPPRARRPTSFGRSGHGRAALPSGASASSAARAPPPARATKAAAPRADFSVCRSGAAYTRSAATGSARAYGGSSGSGASPAAAVTKYAVDAANDSAATGRPTQKRRSATASSRPHTTMQPSSDADTACSTLSSARSTAVTAALWPESSRTSAPVSHEKSLTCTPAAARTYLPSAVWTNVGMAQRAQFGELEEQGALLRRLVGVVVAAAQLLRPSTSRSAVAATNAAAWNRSSSTPQNCG